jgi:hypothetical protein
MMWLSAICVSAAAKPMLAAGMMLWVATRLVTSLPITYRQAGAWTKTFRCTATCLIRVMARKKRNWARLISLFKTVSIPNRLDYWNHAFGSTTGGENSSLMRNLWADNTGRNPSVGWNGVYNFVNNVVFNWHHRSMDGGDYTTNL